MFSLSALIRDLHERYVFRRRVEILGNRIAEMIPLNASILDVGCGDGSIDRVILDKRSDVSLLGLDVALRASPLIPVRRFDGTTIPYSDKAFDVVMFVDVLHHTLDPMVLIREARRVARTCIVIKDHNRDGLGSAQLLRFMDWIGNAPHGVVLTYNYWPERAWREAFSQLDLTIADYRSRLKLYAIPARWIFERSMHFVARLEVE